MTCHRDYQGVSYFSQPEFRTIASQLGIELTEEELKYNYDRYTWHKKVPPIRKLKVRARIAREAKYFKIDLQMIIKEEWS